jgi:hypothetical protein
MNQCGVLVRRNHFLRRHDFNSSTQRDVLNNRGQTANRKRPKADVENCTLNRMCVRVSVCFALIGGLASYRQTSSDLKVHSEIESQLQARQRCDLVLSMCVFRCFEFRFLSNCVTSLYIISQTSICAIEFFWEKTLSETGDLKLHVRIAHNFGGVRNSSVLFVCAPNLRMSRRKTVTWMMFIRLWNFRHLWLLK